MRGQSSSRRFAGRPARRTRRRERNGRLAGLTVTLETRFPTILNVSQPTKAAFRLFSKRVSALTDATRSVAAVDAGWPKPGYFCTAWRIAGREGRELYLEVPGPSECPGVLRVGLYFLDSAGVSRVQ